MARDTRRTPAARRRLTLRYAPAAMTTEQPTEPSPGKLRWRPSDGALPGASSPELLRLEIPQPAHLGCSMGGGVHTVTLGYRTPDEAIEVYTTLARRMNPEAWADTRANNPVIPPLPPGGA